MTKKIKPLSLVKLKKSYRKAMKKSGYGDYPTMKETAFVFLGMIPNMPGHCVVAGHSGRVYFGLHPEDFKVLKEDEV